MKKDRKQETEGYGNKPNGWNDLRLFLNYCTSLILFASSHTSLQHPVLFC